MALSKFSAEESSESIMAEINITPLTDIFLVLLIIFMITTSAMVDSAAKVNLPKATQTVQEARGLTVLVTADNKIFVNQMPVDVSQLQPTLHDLLADDPKKLVILQGDQSVLLGEAVRIMDIAKRAGAQAISIAAQKEAAPAAAPGGP
ncbi:MAG TPA: biopolymer transporter ExbD [Candidatus Binatia bacterium]|nr:biopolymer transporter ExbD [Candidatus Binatia bacterium]